MKMIAFAIGLLVVCAPALAESCLTVNRSGEYDLNSSIACSNPVYISSSDVVFDCQGNSISSDAQWALVLGAEDFGDYASLSNITVRDCDIENANSVGVYVNPNAFSAFSDVSISDSRLDGGSSDYSLFTNLVVGMTIRNVTMTNGFDAVFTSGLYVVNSTAYNRESEDMPSVVQFSGNVTIVNNTIDSLEIDAVTDSVAVNNVIFGMALDGAHGIQSFGYPSNVNLTVVGNYWTNDAGDGYSDTCFSLFTDHCWFGYAFGNSQGGADGSPLSVKPF